MRNLRPTSPLEMIHGRFSTEMPSEMIRRNFAMQISVYNKPLEISNRISNEKDPWEISDGKYQSKIFDGRWPSEIFHGSFLTEIVLEISNGLQKSVS